MNSIVQDRRGEIFVAVPEAIGEGKSRGHDRDAVASK